MMAIVSKVGEFGKAVAAAIVSEELDTVIKKRAEAAEGAKEKTFCYRGDATNQGKVTTNQEKSSTRRRRRASRSSATEGRQEQGALVGGVCSLCVEVLHSRRLR